MGQVCSSSEKEEEKYVFETSNIYFDEYGNLKYDKGKKPVDREAEMRRIMETEESEEISDEMDYYVVDSAWVESWLQYVYVNQDSPRPGPCRNDRLITWYETGDMTDEKNKSWIGRKGLYMAVKSRSGDYRRVSKTSWLCIKELYPASGPTIRASYEHDEGAASTGLYDTSKWVIEDPPAAPNAQKKGQFGLPIHLTSPKNITQSTPKLANIHEDRSESNDGHEEKKSSIIGEEETDARVRQPSDSYIEDVFFGKPK